MKAYMTVLLVIIVAAASSCAGDSIRGDVIGKWENQLTLRQGDDTVVTIEVDNAKDVRVLDSVLIKKNRAKVEERLLDDDFCHSPLCNL